MKQINELLKSEHINYKKLILKNKRKRILKLQRKLNEEKMKALILSEDIKQESLETDNLKYFK